MTYPLPHPGDPIRGRSVLRNLPVGTIVVTHTGTTYTRQPDGTFTVTARGRGSHVHIGDNHRVEHMHPSRLRLLSYPHDYTQAAVTLTPLPDDVNDQTIILGETLTQYIARFHTILNGLAVRSGVSQRAVQAAMRVLRAEVPPSPGMPVHWHDRTLLDSFPTLTTITFRAKSAGLTVFGKSNAGPYGSDSFTRLIGGHQPGVDAYGRVEHLPGHHRLPWVDEHPTPEDRAAITEFKTRAVEVGERTRCDQDWCSEYQRCMARVDIDTDPDHAVPPVLTADQAAALPAGSVLRVFEGGESRLFVRRDDSPNPARTVGVGGTRQGHWAASADLLWQADSGVPMRIPVRSSEELAGMPPGTRITNLAGSEYIKTVGDTWLHNGGTTHPSRIFSTTDTFYSHIEGAHPS